MNNSKNSLGTRDNKGSQDVRIISHLRNIDASRYMLAKALSIPIQSVCRRVDLLKVQSKVAVIREGKCEISGKWVQFLSSNPDKFNGKNQLGLWPEQI